MQTNSPNTADPPVDPYRQLPQVVQLKGQRLKFSSSAPFTPTYVQPLLPSSQDASSVYASRIQNRQIPLENPTKQSRMKQLADQRKARQQRDTSKRKLLALNRKEAKVKGIWDMKREEKKYELFLPLHRLWKSYMGELLGLSPLPKEYKDLSTLRMPNVQAMQTKLVKADFHGSIMSVKTSKNPSLVGCSGIVILETENTFKVITEKDQLKVIPKKGSTFCLKIPFFSPSIQTGGVEIEEPIMEFELYGDQFAFRSTDRATRKFKYKLI